MNKKLLLLTSLFLATAFVTTTFTRNAEAQVSITIGAQELYDDNIYLEDDGGFPPALEEAVMISEEAGEPFTPPVESDGDPNDDLITHVYIGASTGGDLGDVAKASADVKVGAYFFDEFDNENRLTLDSRLHLAASDDLIPEPFFFTLDSTIASGSTDITVAEGSIARQSATHQAILATGLRGWEVSQKGEVDLGYTLTRSDFLGEFTFDDDEEDIEEEGASFFSNSVSSKYLQKFAPNFDGVIDLRATNYHFTDVETNDLDGKDEDALDRNDFRATVGFNYLPTDDITLSANVGADHSILDEEPEDVRITVVEDDGTTRTIVRERDDSNTSLVFGANARYALSAESALSLGVNQNTSTDIDGDRILVRSANLNFAKNWGDRWEVILGSRFIQYTNNDELDDPTDRYEGSATIKYSITEAILLALGYNYATQSAGDREEAIIFRSEDYDSHKVFIAISGGLVGS